MIPPHTKPNTANGPPRAAASMGRFLLCPGGTLFCLLRRTENLPPCFGCGALFLLRGLKPLAKTDRCPCSASAVSSAGRASAAQSLLDKICPRTAHSPQGGSHTLCGKFPWRCPIHPHMSAGWDDLDFICCRLDGTGLRGPGFGPVRPSSHNFNCITLSFMLY